MVETLAPDPFAVTLPEGGVRRFGAHISFWQSSCVAELGILRSASGL